jgi:MoxR-like ATPase
LDKLKPVISYGASPRGSISLALASKAQAFMNGRGYVTPEDIKSIAHSVLRHRIGLSYEAEAENITSENVVDEILGKVSMP